MDIIIVVCISVVLFKLCDVIKHYMTIKAKERADAEYIARKKKEKEEIEKYNSREERVKRQYGNNIAYWFTFNGKHFWHDKDVFKYGIARDYCKSAISDKIIANTNIFKVNQDDFYVSFRADKKDYNTIHWNIIPMEFKFDDIKELKTVDMKAEETITKIDSLLNA